MNNMIITGKISSNKNVHKFKENMSFVPTTTNFFPLKK